MAYWDCVLAAVWTFIGLYTISAIGGVMIFGKWVRVHEQRFDHLRVLENRNSQLEQANRELRYEIERCNKLLKKRSK